MAEDTAGYSPHPNCHNPARRSPLYWHDPIESRPKIRARRLRNLGYAVPVQLAAHIKGLLEQLSTIFQNLAPTSLRAKDSCFLLSEHLLRGTRVLTLDEATAPVDSETDMVVKRMLSSELLTGQWSLPLIIALRPF
jgi:hypothetical protein